MKEPFVLADSPEIIVKMSEIGQMTGLLAVEYHISPVRLKYRCGHITDLVG